MKTHALTNAELVSILNERIERARVGGLNDEYRRLALAYYLNRARDEDVKGRSHVQDSSVADMIHAIMAQLAPAFAGDSICEFESEGPQDDNQARLETLAVNKVLSERNRGYVSIQEAIHDALLMRVGIIKGWVEESEESETREYDRGQLSDDQYAAIQRPSLSDEEVSAEEDEDSISITRTRTLRRLLTKAVDPLNFYVDQDTDTVLLDEVRGVYERREMTRGELLEAGYEEELISELPLLTLDYYASQRRPGGINTGVDVRAGWASELVEVWDCHVRIDMNGDNRAELLRIVKGKNTILSVEDATYIPYAAGTALIFPHQFHGLSMFDRQKSVQDVRTAVLRQALDCFAASNLCRTGVDIERIVDPTDLTDGRVNGVIKTRGNPAEVIQPIPNLDISAQAVALLQYTEAMRADKGGAALQMASGEAQLVGQQMGSLGADRILSVQEQLSGYFARNLAETLIRSTFLLIHRLMRTELTEPVRVLAAGQQVQVDPMQWPARDRINIKAGLSPGERGRRAQNMMAVIQYQGQLAQAGLDGVLVNADNHYAALMDWGAASDIDNPGKYFLDPRSQQSQQAGQQKGQQMQQSQQQQLQMQMQLAQIPLQVEQMRAQFEKYKADLDARTKMFQEYMNAEIEEAKLVGGATRDLKLAEFTARTAAASGGGGTAQDAA